MKPYITNTVGTWWLVANVDGTLLICDGNKPLSSHGGWIGKDNTYRWTVIENTDLDPESLPKVTYETSPIQIEVDEDGNISWYKE